MAAATESYVPMNGGSRPMPPGPQRDNEAPLPPVPAGDGPGDELDPSYREKMHNVLSSDDFAAFLKERSALEEKHSQGLKRLSRATHDSIARPEGRQGTFAENYKELTSIHERIADHGLQFSNALFGMSEELYELAANTERGRKHWKQAGMSAEKRVQDAETAMEKAKNRYHSLAEQYDRARTGERQSGKFGLKRSAAQAEEDLRHKLEAADADYAAKVDSAQSLRNELLSTHRPQTTNALQELTREIDAGLSGQVQKFANLSEKLMLGYGLCVTPMKAQSSVPGQSPRSLREAASGISNERDFIDFVLAASTKAPPQRANEIKYEKHPSLSPKQQQPDYSDDNYPSMHSRQVSGVTPYPGNEYGDESSQHPMPLQGNPQGRPASAGRPQTPQNNALNGGNLTSGSPSLGPGQQSQPPRSPSPQLGGQGSPMGRGQPPMGPGRGAPLGMGGGQPQGMGGGAAPPGGIGRAQPPPGSISQAQGPPGGSNQGQPPLGGMGWGQTPQAPTPQGQGATGEPGPTPQGSMGRGQQPPPGELGRGYPPPVMGRGQGLQSPGGMGQPQQPGMPPQSAGRGMPGPGAGGPPNGAPRPGGVNALPSRQAVPKAGPPVRPVFGVSLDELFQREGSAVPFIVMQCVQAVDMYGLNVEGIYRTSGSANNIMELRQKFDHDANSVDLRTRGADDIASVTTLLKHFLRDLPDPLLTAAQYRDFIQAAKLEDAVQRRDAIHALVNALPDPNYATLRVLTIHLHKVAQHSSSNKMTHNNLAIVFAPTLMGQRAGVNGNGPGSADIADSGWQAKVVETILDNTFQIFDADE
ncbi:hypothetical protein A1O7_00699 [Cladophialophora yegresii CBS 114405]|uniref:Rho-GAP domain-containing protein n=1 Tax=Cladophialophora yegresii CBS 114405 TaxID=1182544 RepID=W9W8V3_9EURO|nr:uncharacterized protein A1O7_00699 [Cladophialophora yegresii CBS 114405]EXJ64363.1 hypothetical protein A1O7_00699 [Cladophialophora yegresii CBS 114405]